MYVRRARAMFMPDTVTHSIENDGLETVITSHMPPDVGSARHLWHDFFGEDKIAADELGDAAFDWIHA